MNTSRFSMGLPPASLLPIGPDQDRPAIKKAFLSYAVVTTALVKVLRHPDAPVKWPLDTLTEATRYELTRMGYTIPEQSNSVTGFIERVAEDLPDQNPAIHRDIATDGSCRWWGENILRH